MSTHEQRPRRSTFSLRGAARRALLQLLALSLLGVSYIAAAQDDFTRANQAYQQGNPSEALSLYQSMRQAGVEDAALYFNMGNAYAAQAQVGEAILSYVRALRLSPGDEDIRANLLSARRHAAENAEPPRVGPLPTLREEQLGGASTAAELFWRGALLYISGFMSLGAALLLRRRGRRGSSRAGFIVAALSLAGAVLFGVLSWQQHSALQDDRRAVVLQASTPVRRGPSESAELIYSLPIGEIVSIEERRELWGLVRIPERPDGWVLLSQVEPVLP